KTSFSSVISFLLITAISAAARPPFACDPGDSSTGTFAFCRRDLPIEDRVRDLVGRLTLPEKVKLLGSSASAVSRLGIRGYEWWSEALHGISNLGPGTRFGGDFPRATSFPQVITTAAAFNDSLWFQIGKAVSDEGRAMYNGGMGGLTYWSPNVNIFRDPRWGRGQETPGEDPHVAAVYAARYVAGLQGRTTAAADDDDRLKVAACCKHYTAYDLDNWAGVDRFHFNAVVSKQDIEDTFDVPFRSCVTEGRVASVMCSYNQVNGIPTCADPNLLRRTVRNSWHLDGYIVSDCDSVGVFYKDQHYSSTPEQAAAAAIRAGLDLDCGSFLSAHAEEAIRKELIKEAEIDVAVGNTVRVQMRLGMFDGDPLGQTYGNLGPKDVCSPAHQDLALDAAHQGIVLLKNEGNSLPLSAHNHRPISVIGPNSQATVTMIGNYAGVACGFTSPLQGVRRYGRAVHQPGCADVACADDGLFGGAVEVTRRADAVVLVMGLDQSIEAEFRDRAGLLLPGRQQELVSRVAAAAKGPVVLVVMSGGPVDVSFAESDPKIGAILWVGYPGQAGGAAIADVIFGAHNPGGKLPVTWYPQEYLTDLPMTAMAMRADPRRKYPGRTYRFYEGTVVYPFGHGLSYTTFVHAVAAAPDVVPIHIYGRHRGNSTAGAVRVSRARCAELSVGLEVDVRNTGSRDGTDTLLVFSSPPGGAWAPPRKQLVAFEKLAVPAGETRRVSLSIHVCKSLSVVDRRGERRIPMGEHRLFFGDDANHALSLEPQVVG
ncbi:hypothetical protein M569_14372, partial [Genlisea aurea]